jgi:hypothetical protein
LLDRVRAARPSVEIETIELLKHPARLVADHVFTIPTLIVAGRRWVQPPTLPELLAALDGLEGDA